MALVPDYIVPLEDVDVSTLTPDERRQVWRDAIIATGHDPDSKFAREIFETVEASIKSRVEKAPVVDDVPF